jgi:hypothetical protein
MRGETVKNKPGRELLIVAIFHRLAPHAQACSAGRQSTGPREPRAAIFDAFGEYPP